MSVLHNQHFPIAEGIFPPKLPLCKIRILYRFDKRINLPRAELPKLKGLPRSWPVRADGDTQLLQGTWLCLGLSDKTPEILKGSGLDQGVESKGGAEASAGPEPGTWTLGLLLHGPQTLQWAGTDGWAASLVLGTRLPACLPASMLPGVC